MRNAAIYNGSGGKRPGPDDNLVVSDVNVDIRKGELVYLIGRVGSGKSSFLRTLYADLPLYSGTGTVAGFELHRIKRKQIPYLRRKLGIVFQDYKLLGDRNVYENLRFVLKSTGWKSERLIQERITAVLTRVGLSHKIHKMPSEMSGGEQQRLAVARALLNDPEVILADEPTGNLDPSTADSIMAIFQDVVASGCAVVMATHNIQNLQSYPSRTLRFNNGKVEDIDISTIFSKKKE
ncbi:ATP-binding cassette domain-containing protein [Alistipes sp. OttesenSCG-928-L06]|nr:ATP-binding cassette domain-containing protein [Alistipes sp. OttesenSCG-928-L06]